MERKLVHTYESDACDEAPAKKPHDPSKPDLRTTTSTRAASQVSASFISLPHELRQTILLQAFDDPKVILDVERYLELNDFHHNYLRTFEEAENKARRTTRTLKTALKQFGQDLVDDVSYVTKQWRVSYNECVSFMRKVI